MEILILILILIALDIITGTIKAIATNTFSSKEMRKGIIRKSGTILLVLLAYGLQYASTMIAEMPQELGLVYDGISIYVCIMEIASNVENILVINPELGGDAIRKFFNLKSTKVIEDEQQNTEND